MTIIYHGTTHYAVYGRAVGTFGGRNKNASLRIYDTRDCGTPRTTISGEMARKCRETLGSPKSWDRNALQAYLEDFLPSKA